MAITSSSSKESSAPSANGGQNGNGKAATITNGEKPTSTPVSSSRQRTGANSGSLISNYMKLRRASKRALPTDLGDGRYRQIVKRPGLGQDIKSISMADLKTLLEIISSKVKGEVQQDDKTMIMERTIQLVAGLPDHSRTQETLTNSFIGQLWDSLDHPPLLYMGDEFKWRRPDGSFNNPLLPHLGAAGTKYSRSVKPHITPLGALPDPEVVYEAVMARGGFKKNPNNVSSILWYWATIIIHDLFYTNIRDGDVNDASSYLDLAPLYGGTQEAQNSIRTFQDGLLKPDTFADKRLIGNPPGVVIILIMFNRFHNHVAGHLAAINEGGRFTKPQGDPSDEKVIEAWKKYDDDLFQTARLVTSGLYINITLIDYVRNIVNLNRVDSTWTLDPRQEMGTAVGTKSGSEAGVGNAVSAEFNLCYRWHSCISEKDDKWIQDFFVELLGENYGEMNLQTLIGAMKKFEASIPGEPSERTFGGFTRGADGMFSDDDLVDCLATAIEQPGGAFGARNVPRIMKPIEMLGIIRGRKWNLAGLNEFRKHFGMKAYATFEDINSDPAVAEALRNLYQHPDYVELYPGVVAEEAKTPMVPGVGIAPTYTISRVVLSDAVSLVRGDRYYTTDYHPGNLTNWGFKEVEYDFNINHGCVFYKLFNRAFPNHFKSDSVYSHYPMVTPSENLKILKNLKRDELFSFDRPTFRGQKVAVTSYATAKHVLSSELKYLVDWQQGIERLMSAGSNRLTLPGDAQLQAKHREVMSQHLYKDGWRQAVGNFYSETLATLLKEKSYEIAGQKQVDVVRDIGNIVHTHFIARLFNLPLKTKANPRGVFTEQELYQALAVILTSICFDTDTVKSFPLRREAKAAAEQLIAAAETNVKLSLSLGLKGLFTKQPKSDPMGLYGVNLIKALAKDGLNAYDIAWGQVVPTASAMVPHQAQFFAQSLDWYLSPAGEKYRPELHRVAALQPSEHADSLLLGYAMEGIRLSGAIDLYRQAGTVDTIVGNDGRSTDLQPGTHVFLTLGPAVLDSAYFREPLTVDPKRSLDSYIYFGAGPYGALTKDVSQVALIELFRAMFRKKNLRRVPGPQGMLKKVPGESGMSAFMTEDWGSLSKFPTTMKVMWDDGKVEAAAPSVSLE